MYSSHRCTGQGSECCKALYLATPLHTDGDKQMARQQHPHTLIHALLLQEMKWNDNHHLVASHEAPEHNLT